MKLIPAQENGEIIFEFAFPQGFVRLVGLQQETGIGLEQVPYYRALLSGGARP